MSNIIHIDFHGLDVSFQSDGWFNATAVASAFGKEPTAWLRQRDTVNYMAAIARRSGNSGFLTEIAKINDLAGDSAASRAKLLAVAKASGLIRSKSGPPEKGGGTWLHPQLAVAFARWCDDDFAVWCDEQIREIIAGNHTAFDWRRGRSMAAATCKAMNATLLKTRELCGKETEAHHYMNESKLVNGVVLGAFKGAKRDALDTATLNAIANVELDNLIMIAQGLAYADRKSELMLKNPAPLFRIEQA